MDREERVFIEEKHRRHEEPLEAFVVGAFCIAVGLMCFILGLLAGHMGLGL